MAERLYRGRTVCPWKTSLFYKPAQYPSVGHASKNFTLNLIKSWQLDGHYFTRNTIKSVRVDYVLLCATAIKHYKKTPLSSITKSTPASFLEIFFLFLEKTRWKRNHFKVSCFQVFSKGVFKKLKGRTKATPQVSLQKPFQMLNLDCYPWIIHYSPGSAYWPLTKATDIMQSLILDRVWWALSLLLGASGHNSTIHHKREKGNEKAS